MARRSERPAPAKLFVDSGAWLAFFSARDNRHADADRLIRQAFERKIPLLTTNLVIAEVHRLLLHRAGIQPAFAALQKIEASAAVRVSFADPAIHRGALRWLGKLADQVISYTDAASFAAMEANRCRHALSFDHDFELAGFTLWRGDR